MIIKNKLLSISVDNNISIPFLSIIKNKIKKEYELNFKHFDTNSFAIIKELYNNNLIQIRFLYKENIPQELILFCLQNNINLIIEDFNNFCPIKKTINNYGCICGCRIFIDKKGIVYYGTCNQRQISHINIIKEFCLLKQKCNQKQCKGVNILFLEDDSQNTKKQ